MVEVGPHQAVVPRGKEMVGGFLHSASISTKHASRRQLQDDSPGKEGLDRIRCRVNPGVTLWVRENWLHTRNDELMQEFVGVERSAVEWQLHQYVRSGSRRAAPVLPALVSVAPESGNAPLL